MSSGTVLIALAFVLVWLAVVIAAFFCVLLK
jgi:hypothetical protein